MLGAVLFVCDEVAEERRIFSETLAKQKMMKSVLYAACPRKPSEKMRYDTVTYMGLVQGDHMRYKI